MTIIDCVADLHGFFPSNLLGGDLLIIAGDCTSNDKTHSWNSFFNWIDKQNYKRKIMIAGNHDNFCKSWAISDDSVYDVLLERPTITYLCDSGTEFEGLKIWGSPWTLKFDGMNPHCMAFTVDTEEELAEKWSLIPDDIDILITHGPMKYILDQNIDGYSCGSTSLRDAIERVMPKIHICGHIHEQGGKTLLYKHDGPNTFCINASYVNEYYKPVNKPIRITL